MARPHLQMEEWSILREHQLMEARMWQPAIEFRYVLDRYTYRVPDSLDGARKLHPEEPQLHRSTAIRK